MTAMDASKNLDTLLADTIAKFKARPGAVAARYDTIKMAAQLIRDTPQEVDAQMLDLVKQMLSAKLSLQHKTQQAKADFIKSLEDHVLDLSASMQEMSNALGEAPAAGNTPASDAPNGAAGPQGVWKP